MDKNLIFSNPLKYGNYKYIKSHWLDEYEVVSMLSGRNFSEKLYKYLTESTGSFCIVCGKPAKFISIKDGYARYCSQKCACRDPQRQEKIKQKNKRI